MFKVLIVEDETMIRKGLQYSFDWLGLECVVTGEATNGIEGTAKIKELRPDIVITDVGMPLMNGIEMLKQTIEEYDYAAIVVSVYDEFHYAKEAMHLGVSEYLLKPLEHEQLAAALMKAKEQCKKKWHFKNSVVRTEHVMEQDVLEWSLVMPETFKSHRVEVMTNYIRDNYKKKISIDDLVEELHTSATYLNQKFKVEMGYTFNEFLNRYRIQMAIGLLKKTDYKIYNVAAETGFKDYKYFVSVFKRYTGVLPGDFKSYFNQEENRQGDVKSIPRPFR